MKGKRSARTAGIGRSEASALALAGSVVLWQACAGNPNFTSGTNTNTTSNSIAQQNAQAQTLLGTRVSFFYGDYFTLTQPNPNSNCAGDMRTYYDPLAVTNADAIAGSVAADLAVPSATQIPAAQASPLPLDVTDASGLTTIRPSFVKNISVDLTDSNAPVPTNLAYACSLGDGNTVPPVSHCATFDYGAIGGIPTTMGGTLLLIGGTQSIDYGGYLPTTALRTSYQTLGSEMTVSCGPLLNDDAVSTTCGGSMYALGIDILPASAAGTNIAPGLTAATGPISTWANIAGVSGYSGPQGIAGASVAYDPGLQRIVIQGGASPLAGMGPTGPGVTTFDTWTFDLKAQAWTSLSPNVFIDSTQQTMTDANWDPAPGASGPVNGPSGTVQLSKAALGRSLFGYASAPRMALTGFTTDGKMSSAATNGQVDTTDRLMIVGGFSQNMSETGPYRFNPTFGPDFVDELALDIVSGGTDSVVGPQGSGLAAYPTSGPTIVQWMDNYTTQIMFDTLPATAPILTGTGASASRANTGLKNGIGSGSKYLPVYPYDANGSTNTNPGQRFAVQPGLVSLYDSAVSTFGYLLAMGGFDFSVSANSVNVPGNCATTTAINTSQAYTSSNLTVDFTALNTPGTYDASTCGTMYLNMRYGMLPAQQDVSTSSFLGLPDNLYGAFVSPALWVPVEENNATLNGVKVGVPAYGGAIAAIAPSPASNRSFARANNEVVFVGGSLCRNFLTDAADPYCVDNPLAFDNPGHYWHLGTNPAASYVDNHLGSQYDEHLNMADPSFLVFDFTSSSGTLNNPNAAFHWGGRLDQANNTYVAAPTALSTFPTTGNYGLDPAGMAFARGEDSSGQVILLAWGGVKNSGQTNTDTQMYYMVPIADNSAGVPAGQPQINCPNGAGSTCGVWVQAQSTGTVPPGYANAAMVFSHVTRNFYLFGGYEPGANFTSADTYEIQINNTCQSPGAQTGSPNCTFNWIQLDSGTNGAGLTCYPSCPGARRSHSMAEVNYNNTNPAAEPTCTDPSAPCSFGIFMEGGTPDGMSVLSERWMFDPTANGGWGHWQLVNNFPPRRLASMASADYYVNARSTTVHRAVMFGGETSMMLPPTPPGSSGAPGAQSAPANAPQYFVPPTLGDTWIYDFDANSWNRATLQGIGAVPTSGANFSASEFSSYAEVSARQIFNAIDPNADARNLAVLSPPPLSGAVMVTRTGRGPAAQGAPPLTVPEVFLFGGRTKDGKFVPLSDVYKFCMGTTGEKPGGTTSLTGAAVNGSSPVDDASCDAFDGNNTAPYNTNPTSPSPTDQYIGRWLRKTPGVTNVDPTLEGSYMGAGTYDPVDDVIVLFGGLKGTVGATRAVTDNLSGHVLAGGDVFEYTAPSRTYNIAGGALNAGATEAQVNGSWNFVPACDPVNAPSPRYGHSLGYDTLNEQLILTGGFDATGNPLIQNQTYSDGRQYTIPDVWAGKRYTTNDAALGITASSANPCYSWRQITTFGNSIDILSQKPPSTGFANAATVYVPASGYNTGFYSMFDNACENSGPIITPDSSINKQLAGGAYFDIDRTQLGTNENLLLHIKYIPLGTTNELPDTTPVTSDEAAYFKVHLVKTGQSGPALRDVFQPRYLTYAATDEYPEVAQTIAVLAPPTGQIREEQIYLPISIDPGIDRVRIERVSGTGILIEAKLLRMGHS
jgi:hypothetical protein